MLWLFGTLTSSLLAALDICLMGNGCIVLSYDVFATLVRILRMKADSALYSVLSPYNVM